MNRNNSPYSATITGCAFLYYEFMRILPLLMSDDSDYLLKEEEVNNKYMQVNSLTSRKRFMIEFKRRYNAVPRNFWDWFLTLEEKARRAALLYVVLKTYRLTFDFHFNVTVKHWNSIDRTLTKSDILMEFNELSAHDSFVDSWTDKTKEKCASQYLTILRQSGLLAAKTDELHQIKLEAKDYSYYFHTGDEWFLEACLLYPYEITDIKSRLQ